MKRLAYSASLAALASGLSIPAAPSRAATPIDTQGFVDSVQVDQVRAHQAALQDIADANDGTRASGTPGFEASVDYVLSQLDDSYFDVSEQEFTFKRFEVLAPTVLEQTAPTSVVYENVVDYYIMTYSGSGSVVAQPVAAVDLMLGLGNTSTSGCEASDFTGFPAGAIALIQRGACTFQLKAENAEAAGAVGAIIFNQGDTEDRKALFAGTLSEDYAGSIPVVSATYDLGAELAATAGLEMTLEASTQTDLVFTSNVIAETKAGRGDRVVMVGAHLDSVPGGPGINDNGSGTATILEIARQLALGAHDVRNKVRFAWWGAEEAGLVGSQHYVDQLSAGEIKDIALNLNFDMLGSPNFVRFVYDGDGDATGGAGPNGSARIEEVFNDWFAGQGLATSPTAFDGRSDYGPFIAVGIPAGGLFSGAEGIKTADEAFVYGGTEGAAYDPCYHLACDTYDNVSLDSLEQMSEAAAHATLTFAETTSAVNGADRASGTATEAVASFEYLGGEARR